MLGAGELLELLHAAVERLAEPLLLGADDALDLGGVLDDLRVPRPDLLDDDARQRIDRGQADPACLNDRAADEPAEDVAAALVRRRHALRDEEGHAAAVVAEHAVRLGRLRRRPVRHARLLGDPVHDQPKAVGVEDRVDALDEHRAALEAHPGVDVLLRERRQRAVGGEVELHEDEVPELDVAVATLAVRAAVGLAAAVLRAAVVVELRARAARAGLPGGPPEVVRARERHDALPRDSHPLPRRDRDLVLPEAEAGIAREDRRPEPSRARARGARVTNSQAKSTAPSLK